MFLSYRPSDARIRAFLNTHQTSQVTYPEVGASREGAPPGYPINHIRYQLGVGSETYARAVAAMQRWTMYATSWTWLYWPETPMEAGATVAVLAHHFGIWSLNPARIVYILQEDQPFQRYGFAIGTLPGHAEQGEERFTVEWHPQDDSVWYELFAFARPRALLARLGAPLVPVVQRRFAVDSRRPMVAAARGERG